MISSSIVGSINHFRSNVEVDKVSITMILFVATIFENLTRARPGLS